MSFVKQESTYRNIWIFMNALLSSTKMKLRLWNKETCATNGNIMYVPSKWAYTADPQVLTILEGMVIHEALGHGVNTDHKVYSDAAGRFDSKLGSTILNILEDIFIETRCFNAKPGAQNSLSATVTELVKKEFFGSPGDLAAQVTKNPSGFLVNSLLIQCRARLLGGQQVPLQELLDASDMVIDSLGMRALWEDIWVIAAQSKNSRHTQDNVALTQKILDLLKDAAGEGEDGQPDQSEGQSQEGDEEGESQPSDQKSKSKAKSKSKKKDSTPSNEDSPSEDSEGEGEDSQGEGDDAQSGSQSESDAGKSSDGKGSKPKPSKADKAKQKAAQDILDSQDEKMPEVELTDLMAQIVEQLLDDEGINDRRVRELQTTKARPMGRCPEVASISHRVKRISDDLQDALMSQTRCLQSLKMSGRRISSSNLARVAVGNPYIFKHKDVGEGLSTAVSLLVDDSGSMNHMSSWCSGLILALGGIFDEFEIPFEVALFSDEYAHIKEFEQSWSQVSAIDNNWSLGGCTLAGAAAQESVGNLAWRTEDRRMLVFVTDGDTPDIDKLESVYSEALEQGIEIASIMMGQTVPQVKRLAAKFGFPAITCNNVDQLASFALERILHAVKA